MTVAQPLCATGSERESKLVNKILTAAGAMFLLVAAGSAYAQGEATTIAHPPRIYSVPGTGSAGHRLAPGYQTKLIDRAALGLIGAQASGMAPIRNGLIQTAHDDSAERYEGGTAVQRMSSPKKARPYAAAEQTGVDNGAFRQAAAEQTGVDNGHL